MLTFRELSAAELAQMPWETLPLTALLPSAEYAAETAAAHGSVIAVFDAEQIIGLLGLEGALTDTAPQCGVVSALVLLPQYRRQGLGRTLMGMAAGAVMQRGAWFIAGAVPDTDEAKAFADAVGMRETALFSDMRVLDLTDVDGLRHG